VPNARTSSHGDGAKAEAWCLRIHADAFLSVSLSLLLTRGPRQKPGASSYMTRLPLYLSQVSKCLTPVLAAAALVAMYVCVHESGHAVGAQ